MKWFKVYAWQALCIPSKPQIQRCTNKLTILVNSESKTDANNRTYKQFRIMLGSYLCCKSCFVETKQNSKDFSNLMAKYLSDFASCRAQCGYKGSLKEIYVPIAQKKKSLPHTWNKSQVQIRNTYPWCFNNLIWNALFSVSLYLWVYLIEDE